MKKPLKVAGWSGILIFVLVFVFTIINQISIAAGVPEGFMIIVSLIYSFFINVFTILFAYGFVILGRKYNGRLLVVLSWISIIFALLMLIFSMIGNIVSVIPAVSAQDDSAGLLIPESPNYGTLEDGAPINVDLILGFIILFIIISILVGIYSILFGVGLLKIEDKVELAKTAGILNIVAGATLIIIIGWFISIVATVVEIIMFFKASRKLEK